MKQIEELDTSTKKDIIIAGLMRSKGVYLFVSKPKVGKYMLALQLSYCLTNGLPFLKHKVTLSPVLYIST
ncbi:MAG: AAA family ATPase [Bacilli bacterium]|nr:AAA family ATPase [Bacilli bacterium]